MEQTVGPAVFTRRHAPRPTFGKLGWWGLAEFVGIYAAVFAVLAQTSIPSFGCCSVH